MVARRDWGGVGIGDWTGDWGLRQFRRLVKAPAANQTFPFCAALISLAQEENFNCAAGGLVAVQSGGDHPAVVGDQKIAHVQILADVVEMAMLDRPRLPAQDEQTAAVPRLGGLLGNEGGGGVRSRRGRFACDR